MDTMWWTLNNLLCFKNYPELTYLHCKDMDFFVTLHQKFKEKQV